ncbi:MAG TPA: D-aminoacylase [Bryobacteraceae bacterium]|jgi:dihydroorotase/N-acyl-D-amino-acid deacylase|nr:D-aminoacylase [Bryobacteraceae bacterium]
MLLLNALVFDGSGAEPYRASILVKGDRIERIAPDLQVANCPVLDCSGFAVCPGFIDLHSHSDVQVLEHRTEKLNQGITTEVVGNCGFSPFPLSENLREFAGGILGREGDWGWPSARAYLEALGEAEADTRSLALAGHGSLRVAVCGLRQDPLPARELDRLAGLLEESLDAGCVGFSTGLMYAPGSAAGREELEPLCRIVAKKGKLYATHMRSYSAGLLDALREQIDLAERTGCRLQVSHLQAAGRKYWPLQEPALAEIELAHDRGIDIEFDIYPYQCGSTVLTQLLPQWTLDGGTDALLARLRDQATRRAILEEMESSGAKLWSDVTISSVASSKNADTVGKTVTEVAALCGEDPGECALDLLVEEQGAVNMITFNQSEENLRQLITHPLCSVITDGFYVKGKPHPRLYGTYPELLGRLVRERKWLSLAEAIYKSTGKPAMRLNLRDRGLLRPGYIADLVIFDPAHIASHATYEAPEASPEGIAQIIKNGHVAVMYGNPLLTRGVL